MQYDIRTLLQWMEKWIQKEKVKHRNTWKDENSENIKSNSHLNLNSNTGESRAGVSRSIGLH